MTKVTNKLDTQYNAIVGGIIKNGVEKTDRTGTGTFSEKGLQFRLDMADGFPLVTTKKVHLKSIILELMWFLRGDTSQRTLKNSGCGIWDEWADNQGRLGPVYGAMWCRRPAANIEYVECSYGDPVEIVDHGKDALNVVGKDVYLNFAKAAEYYKAFRAYKNPSNKCILPLSTFKEQFVYYACDSDAKINAKLGAKYTVAYTQWKNILECMASDETLAINHNWLHFHRFLEDFSVLPGNEICGTRNTAIFLKEQNSNKKININTVEFIRSEDYSYIKAAEEKTIAKYSTVEDSATFFQPVFYINQIENVLDQIKAHSDSRRIIVDGWEPSLLPLSGVEPCDQAIFGRQALPPCHTMFQFFVDPAKKAGGKKRLSLHLTQR